MIKKKILKYYCHLYIDTLFSSLVNCSIYSSCYFFPKLDCVIRLKLIIVQKFFILLEKKFSSCSLYFPASSIRWLSLVSISSGFITFFMETFSILSWKSFFFQQLSRTLSCAPLMLDKAVSLILYSIFPFLENIRIF